MAAHSRHPARHLTRRRRVTVAVSLAVAASCAGFAAVLAVEGLWVGAAGFFAVAAANAWFAYRPPARPPRHPLLGALAALAAGVVVVLLVHHLGREVVALLALFALAAVAPVGVVLAAMALFADPRWRRPR